jgi:hypothetical protein
MSIVLYLLKILFFAPMLFGAEPNTILSAPNNTTKKESAIEIREPIEKSSEVEKNEGTEKKDSSHTPPPVTDKEDYLRIDPANNNIAIPSAQLVYDINDTSVTVGQTELSDSTVKIFLGNPTEFLPVLKIIEHPFTEQTLYLSLPAILFPGGKIEIIGESGNVIWAHDYTADELELGEKIRQASPSKRKSETIYLTTELPLESIPFFAEKRKGFFRFCLHNQEGEDYYTKICSPPNRISNQTRKLKSISEVTAAKAYINSKEGKLKDAITAAPDQVTHFYGVSGNQYSLELKTKPYKLYVIDYFKDLDSKSIVFTGHTNFPSNRLTLPLNPVDTSSILFRLGWVDTIGDLRNYWRSRVPFETPTLFMKGIGGGEYSYPFKIQKALRIDKRAYVAKNSLHGTYSSELPLYGIVPPNFNVTSKQESAKIIDKKKGRFTWNYSSNQNGLFQYKTMHMEDRDENTTWKASYQVYKGYNNEFSLRYGGILTQKLQANTLGEFSYNRWFEHLFWLENRYISRQRWGISIRGINPIDSYRIKKYDVEKVSLTLRTLDLKYRITPGLWERDETFGLIGAYEDVLLNKVRAPMIGTGFFWARSMPKLFDDLFNYFTFFRYPKWVDLDFTFYSTSLKQSIESKATYTLNFHGKILWSKVFFGEAGFGLRSFDFKDYEKRRYSSLTVFYGTTGLGFNF